MFQNALFLTKTHYYICFRPTFLSFTKTIKEDFIIIVGIVRQFCDVIHSEIVAK